METLVLNATYEPMSCTSLRRAVNLVLARKVEIVEAYPDREIRSASFVIKAPAVVRFLNFIQGKGKAVRFSKGNVYLRDHGKCAYCGDKVPQSKATVDHVIPRSRGGKTVWTNVVVCCHLCNQRKGSLTPHEAGMPLRVTPSRPKALPSSWRVTLRLKNSPPVSWRDYLPAISIESLPKDSQTPGKED